MTLREHFAAMAMQALVSNETYYSQLILASNEKLSLVPQVVSMIAVEQADALIKALNR